MRIYCDASPLIYFVEQSPGFMTVVEKRLFEPDESGQLPEVVISDLTRMECRIGPLKRANASTLHHFDELFADLKRVELIPAIWDEAARIRATYGFKTPDSLHLAAALGAGCDSFYTNDHRLDRFGELKIEAVI